MLEKIKGDSMVKTKVVSNSLCIALNDAIKDENKAPKMYEDILHDMSDNGLLTFDREQKIREIISQEKNHEKEFIRMAAEMRCPIDQKKYIK